MKDNEYFAKVFGYEFQEHPIMFGGPPQPRTGWYLDGEYIGACPDFTGDVDVMIAEVERRGLHWEVSKDYRDYPATIWGSSRSDHRQETSQASGTPALALAEALEAYLEANHE